MAIQATQRTAIVARVTFMLGLMLPALRLGAEVPVTSYTFTYPGRGPALH